MSSFGSVIPVTGLNLGFRGQVSRTGGGDPFIVAKQANTGNLVDITFGDPVMLLPDSTGGTYRQAGDFFANGGGLAIATTTTSSSATATPANLNGLVPGMFISGPGIPVGTTIATVNQAAGTITMSQNATASSGPITVYYASFAGIAVREVKSQLTYPITPGSSQIGTYKAGQICEVLVRGSISAQIYVGTPVAGGQVYLRAVANGAVPAGVVGQLEASTDTAKNILLPGVEFKTGVLDGNNISEVTLLNRVAV